MCGIVGVMTEKLFLGDHVRFKDLFTVAQLRGDDGAGMFAVPAKEEVTGIRCRRTTWSSGHFVTTNDYDEVVKGDTSILVGHARQPTRGKSEIANVHPHGINQEFYLVHNGTMNSVDGKVMVHTESDSKAVTRCIYEKGVEHFVDSSYGAYCLVWADIRNQTLNFLRNKERPLYIVEIRYTQLSEEPYQLWWASEFWMIPTILSRYAGYNKDCVKIYSLPVDEHWTFPLSVSKRIAAPTKVKREKPYVPVYSARTYFGGESDLWDYDDASKSNTTSDTGGGSAVVPFRGSNTESTQKHNANNTSAITSSPGVSTSTGFKYVAPDSRPAVLSSGRIFEQSKADADLATAKRLSKTINASVTGGAPKATFPDSDYAEKDKDVIKRLVTFSDCVWCGNKPAFSEESPPKIYPCRFTTDRRDDYICDGCVGDLDVQRMLGFA